MHSYLAAMGIQTWQGRRVFSGAKAALDFKIYLLLRSQTEWGYFLLANPTLGTLDEQRKTMRLLGEMFQVFELKLGQELTVAEWQAAPVSAKSLVMGATLKSDKKNTLTLAHPLELLRNPLHKGEVWVKLKKYFCEQ